VTRATVDIRSLIIATDLDVLPASSTIEDHGAYVVVRSTSNPSHYWGNVLIWRDAPQLGDREHWEATFLREFGTERESSHVAFTWDTRDGKLGAAEEELAAFGYDLESEVGLVATPEQLVEHPRANRDVTIRQLDWDGDEQLWAAAIDLMVDNRDDGHGAQSHRTYVERRMRDRRELFAQGRGAWFLALTPDGEAAASCGVVVTDGRARFQSVDAAKRFRRRGIASRMVHDAGRAAIDEFGADRLVIVADADYHALPLYQSLGFVELERAWGACWWPGSVRAGQHPSFGHA
jgi:ribosomal protein S18 acetylase RimI-like enzyme